MFFCLSYWIFAKIYFIFFVVALFIGETHMDETTRIGKDILMYEENVKTVDKEKLDKGQLGAYELSRQYYQDSKYYLEKGDVFTSFGCINYAHGLLDAITKF
jgi:hypothetical protein